MTPQEILDIFYLQREKEKEREKKINIFWRERYSNLVLEIINSCEMSENGCILIESC